MPEWNAGAMCPYKVKVAKDIPLTLEEMWRKLMKSLFLRPGRLFWLAAACALFACFEDHPVVSPGNVADFNTTLREGDGLSKFDSLTITVLDKREGDRILFQWTGPFASFDKVPMFAGS